jgi:hypothetical protein
LQGSAKARPDGPVAGIPVDSQYVIFVIDTSGSMQQMAWRSVQQKMNEALDAYPQIKGFQVMSDMGEYMFSSYRGDWIPDTPARRRTVLQRLTNWAPFSNSSPVEGITAAIRTYARADRKISIYVFGDDFTGRSINDVVLTVRRINPRDRSGRPSVRIHGIGFPVLMNNRGAADGALRFANLMRVLAEVSITKMTYWLSTGMPATGPSGRALALPCKRRISSVRVWRAWASWRSRVVVTTVSCRVSTTLSRAESALTRRLASAWAAAARVASAAASSASTASRSPAVCCASNDNCCACAALTTGVGSSTEGGADLLITTRMMMAPKPQEMASRNDRLDCSTLRLRRFTASPAMA